jgi:hypothetical protein
MVISCWISISSISLSRVLKIWEFIRMQDSAVFYYSRSTKTNNIPSGCMPISRDVVSLLSGPALLYKRSIIVATDCYFEAPYSESLIMIRLRWEEKKKKIAIIITIILSFLYMSDDSNGDKYMYERTLPSFNFLNVLFLFLFYILVHL